MNYENLSAMNLPDEDWRDIQGYEGSYQVSNMGRIRSLDRTVIKSNGLRQDFCGKIMKQEVGRNGYLFIKFRKNGVKSCFTPHRLVAVHFIENPKSKPEVNHKDGNKWNNTAENLEWNTRGENMQHSYNIGLSHSGEKHWKSKLRKKDIPKIREMYLSGIGQSEISRVFSVSRRTIANVINGKIWVDGWKQWAVDNKDVLESLSLETLKGEQNPKSKLSELDVSEIHKLRLSGMKYHQIANIFSVEKSTIGKIIRRERWQHLPNKKILKTA